MLNQNKQTSIFFQTAGRASGAPVLDPPSRQVIQHHFKKSKILRSDYFHSVNSILLLADIPNAPHLYVTIRRIQGWFRVRTAPPLFFPQNLKSKMVRQFMYEVPSKINSLVKNTENKNTCMKCHVKSILSSGSIQG